MEDLKKLLLGKAEELGWEVAISGDGDEILAEFRKYSMAGEDFGFSVWAFSIEGISAEVQCYYEDFDPEEHAAGWCGKAGAPGLRVLLDDADGIDSMLGELARELGDVVENWYLEHSGDEEDE